MALPPPPPLRCIRSTYCTTGLDSPRTSAGPKDFSGPQTGICLLSKWARLWQNQAFFISIFTCGVKVQRLTLLNDTQHTVVYTVGGRFGVFPRCSFLNFCLNVQCTGTPGPFLRCWLIITTLCLNSKFCKAEAAVYCRCAEDCHTTDFSFPKGHVAVLSTITGTVIPGRSSYYHRLRFVMHN